MAYRHDNKAIGPMYMAQLTLQLFMDEADNDENEKQMAAEIHRWLGNTHCKIDNVFNTSYDYGIFLLQIMKTYEMNETKNQYCFVSQFTYALNSLQNQYNKHIDKEELLQKMALAAITDTHLRGYD